MIEIKIIVKGDGAQTGAAIEVTQTNPTDGELALAGIMKMALDEERQRLDDFIATYNN